MGRSTARDPRPRFADISFQYTDASSELTHTPRVISDAFVDLGSCLADVLKPDKYIIHGAKGSGKTALAGYYKLTSASLYDRLARLDDIEDLDYSVLNADQEHSRLARFVGVWKYLLALRMYTLLAEDESLRTLNPALNSLLRDVERLGLLPSPSTTKLAQHVLGKGAHAGLSFFVDVQGGADTSATYTPKTPSQIGDSLVAMFGQLRPTTTEFLLFIDGLDHVLRHGEDGLLALADLINATQAINEALLEADIRAKVMVLLRDDVARRIPSPDLGKRLADNAIELDWSRNARDVYQSELFRVIQRRAALVGFVGGAAALCQQWLPPVMYRRPTASFILQHTRYLPRDLIRFFWFLQRQERKAPFGNQTVMAAEREYSQWLFRELCDSLVGLVDESVRINLESVLRDVGRHFYVADLEKALARYNLDDKITGEDLARTLFDGRWLINTGHDDGHRFYSGRGRNSAAGFSSKHECLLIAGLLAALALGFRYYDV